MRKDRTVTQKRNRRAVAILGLVVLPFALWYVGFPLGLKAYYSWLFVNAQSITVTDRFGDAGGPSIPAKTITRRDHPDLFARIADSIHNGYARDAQCKCAARWRLHLSDAWGHTTQVDVCHYLLAEGQPLNRTFWFYPVAPDHDESSPGLVEDFDALMGAGPGSRPAAPVPTPAVRPGGGLPPALRRSSTARRGPRRPVSQGESRAIRARLA
jgi:hypothetical protein